MMKILLLVFFLVVFSFEGPAQVKIKLFSDYSPESAVFTVTDGNYTFLKEGKTITLSKGHQVSIVCLNKILTIKEDSSPGINTDVLNLFGSTGNDAFSILINGKRTLTRYYSGDLICSAGSRSVLMFNICPSEDYIAGVVLAEGGTHQSIEYYKVQSVLARTYMVKYIEENLDDRDFLTDNTDCQVFFGITTDKTIKSAASLTKGQVVLGHDNTIIESPFHSNCGGVTCSSGDVWISHKPYLKSVSDPFCNDSKNARWTKSISLARWITYVKKSGYTGKTEDPSVFNYSGLPRAGNYLVGSYSLPFTRIRTEMNLPSAYFSVILKGDSVVLNGRGFGHGVGLCQEGAMKMAKKGYTYRQIINFYYNGVLISDISKASVLPRLKTLLSGYSDGGTSSPKNESSRVQTEGIIMQASR